MWIKMEIRALYSQLNKCNKEVYNKYWELREGYGFIEIEEILYGRGMEYINKKVAKRENIIKKKLDRLTKDNKQNKGNINKENRYADRIINLSDVKFNKEEMELLGKGLKYVPLKRINKEEVLIQCESIIGRMEKEEDKKCIRHEISNIVENIDMNKNNKGKNVIAGIRKLKGKVKENKLIITKADKGNTIVVMKKEEYIRKTEEFISNGPYEVIRYDYTNKYQAQVKKIMKEKSIFEEFKKKQMIISNLLP